MFSPQECENAFEEAASFGDVFCLLILKMMSVRLFHSCEAPTLSVFAGFTLYSFHE